mmetsp:Transcript_66259/g.205293  ORF Transcript_66259/g.205293 Transcript_66259/m.205293 type:complete len:117 (+) Transcript_66259:2-352(+)
MKLALVALVASAATTSAVSLREHQAAQKPKGPGVPEPSMELACSECKEHAPYLQDCTCFASDVAGTFENDATKKLTTRKGFGKETTNTGAARLSEAWHWHCRPVSGTPDVWKQCPE